jgi:hypothetical protein
MELLPSEKGSKLDWGKENVTTNCQDKLGGILPPHIPLGSAMHFSGRHRRGEEWDKVNIQKQ